MRALEDSPATPLRVMIVDDEEPARRLLEEYLEQYGRERNPVAVVAACANGFEAVKGAAECQPELLLLDIQMPKLDGFEVLEILEADLHVVFTTAHEEHALRAFEVDAVDYLLKPFSYPRFAEAMDRTLERRGRGEPPPRPTPQRPPGTFQERVLVREEGEIVVLPVVRLDYVEARDDYILLKAGEQQHLKQQTLTSLEEALDPRRFVRIHRSYILNLDRLRKIELYAKDSRVAILPDGTRLPVSRSGYAKLKELL